MNNIISTLKKWNDAYPEEDGFLRVCLMDDESGAIETTDNGSIFTFNNLKQFYSTDPIQYKQEHSNAN